MFWVRSCLLERQINLKISSKCAAWGSKNVSLAAGSREDPEFFERDDKGEGSRWARPPGDTGPKTPSFGGAEKKGGARRIREADMATTRTPGPQKAVAKAILAKRKNWSPNRQYL